MPVKSRASLEHQLEVREVPGEAIPMSKEPLPARLLLESCVDDGEMPSASGGDGYEVLTGLDDEVLDYEGYISLEEGKAWQEECSGFSGAKGQSSTGGKNGGDTEHGGLGDVEEQTVGWW
ncbi:hypothetical protein NDU88_004498 [Pleurodeles waltl]|uniref:Uncharacterized protein n=1 Tax=Pleurodeles waltl TaxID=8319 RepID=A0AAV7NNR0_PLEWA|nr:hypothetical protein NDU88_004498 [Pleurodeles waltl]